MSGLPDLELLRWAARENRIIVTHDKKTMIPDAGLCLKIGEPMAGLIYVPRSMNAGAAIRDLQLMVECLSPDELKDQIKRLPL